MYTNYISFFPFHLFQKITYPWNASCLYTLFSNYFPLLSLFHWVCYYFSRLSDPPPSPFCTNMTHGFIIFSVEVLICNVKLLYVCILLCYSTRQNRTYIHAYLHSFGFFSWNSLSLPFSQRFHMHTQKKTQAHIHTRGLYLFFCSQ